MKKMTTKALYTYMALLDNIATLEYLDREERRSIAEKNDDFFAGMDDTRYTARLRKTVDELDAFRKEHHEELDGLCEMFGAYQKEDGHWYIKRQKLIVNSEDGYADFIEVEEHFRLDEELKKMEV
jgi:hypothetical protein